jgi:branched-chain amino acid aminotransferase
MEANKLVYLNGRFLTENEAVISIFDRGFLYGDGVFETMRSYGGNIFRLQQHLQRLRRSAELIKLRLHLTETEMADICNQLLERNGALNAVIRISVTRGRALGGVGTAKAGEPTVAAFIRPPIAIPPDAAESGVSLITSTIMRTPSRALDSRVKSMNYLNLILARSEAEEAGAFDAILLDRNGFLAETSVANIFFARDGRLFTPAPENDILLGITRAAVLELAERLVIRFSEASITPAEMESFEECFLTNSAIELLPVTRIDNKPVGSGMPGDIYRRLLHEYREMVRADG